MGSCPADVVFGESILAMRCVYADSGIEGGKADLPCGLEEALMVTSLTFICVSCTTVATFDTLDMLSFMSCRQLKRTRS